MMIKNKNIFILICCLIIAVSSVYNIKAQEPLIWEKFAGKISNPEIPMLFDYSYAGYKLGEIGIPKKNKHLESRLLVSDFLFL